MVCSILKNSLKEKTMFKSPATTAIGRRILPDFAHSLMVRVIETFQRIRTIDELNELSDEHLRDIGVERREIGSVVERELQRLRRSDLGWSK
jgi:uncharacterized protein YjiS (DUF1127 family)